MKHKPLFASSIINLCVAAVLTVISFQFIGCTKDDEMIPAPTATSPTPSTPSANTHSNNYNVKLVWANEQQYTSHILGSATLKAYYNFSSNIKTYRWRKVDGPTSYKITDSTSSATTVTDLETGVYKFEISVEEINGQRDVDTLYVYVIKPGISEVVFPKMQWICPMGCSTLSIQKIFSFVPANKPLKVFLKYEDSTVWKELIHISLWSGGDEYIWLIDEDNSFSLYANYPEKETEKFDVKIQY
jgi:hypothetical protein